MSYAGKVCGKCGKGCNNDKPIMYIDKLYKQQNKRFGYVCRTCITEIAGGQQELKKLQSKQILSEMGL